MNRVAWVALAAVVAFALGVVVAGSFDTGPRTVDERVASLSERVRCPTCRSQSVADSAAPAADAIRNEIRERAEAGESDAEIEAYLVGRYGSDLLLTPPSGGAGGLVWVLPVVLVVGAGAAVVLALRRWSARPLATPTAADRALVEGER